MMEAMDENMESMVWDYKKKYRDNNPLITAEDQFAGYNLIEKQQRMEAF